ncbi:MULTISPECIES: 2'-5' RNA ligase family protein [Rufibacter]|uniref:2'-5' RNA ligase n=1 Tax=Rufibacter quisquiliarum TaxID=1549639 RepID=A0A839GET6_9BACT|nr:MULTISPECIES: 2'-5' RNA ligase family protein [Rufibacter]MBA9076053.1 2'-5' RNA ligase [Rufibacter quisquiliarum]
MNLLEHYTCLWEETEAQFTAGHFELDPLLDSPHDSRRGLTVLIRPGAEVKARLRQFLQELAQLEPAQYYYPASDIHITLLSIISCYPGFQLGQINLAPYSHLVQQALQGVSPFQVEFTGMTASPSCVMVQGFPLGEQLNQLRNNLRTAFQASGLQQSIDQRYAIQTAHSTVVRFRKPLQQPQQFLEKLREYRHQAFGSCVVREVELVYHDWYQRQENTQVLGRFSL